jgi:DtxR family Mn-dependent transcriptional regulator
VEDKMDKPRPSDENIESRKDGRIVLSESMEDYIETISQLEERLKAVRVKNIAKTMKVKMPSVSSALGVLERKGLVNYEKYDYVELTRKGREVAQAVRKRHDALKKFLIEFLGVDEKSAEEDSCGMEHHISKNTINNIISYMEFMENCPRNQEIFLNSFKTYLDTGVMPQCTDED